MSETLRAYRWKASTDFSRSLSFRQMKHFTFVCVCVCVSGLPMEERSVEEELDGALVHPQAELSGLLRQ